MNTDGFRSRVPLPVLNSYRIFGAIRHGEKGDGVQNLNFLTLGLGPVFNLQVATGVRSGDDCGACFFDMPQFSGKQLLRHRWLDDVVNTGASAAPSRFGEFCELYPRN